LIAVLTLCFQVVKNKNKNGMKKRKKKIFFYFFHQRKQA